MKLVHKARYVCHSFTVRFWSYHRFLSLHFNYTSSKLNQVHSVIYFQHDGNKLNVCVWITVCVMLQLKLEVVLFKWSMFFSQNNQTSESKYRHFCFVFGRSSVETPVKTPKESLAHIFSWFCFADVLRASSVMY